MSFYRKMFLRSLLPDVFCVFMFFLHTLVATQMSPDRLTEAMICIVVMYLGCQFLIAPAVDFILFNGVSKQLQMFENGELDDKQRTRLLISLYKQPGICVAKTVVYYLLGAALMFYILRFVISLSIQMCVLAFIGYIVSSYFVGMMSYQYSGEICRQYAIKIAAAGVDTKYVAKKKFLGEGVYTQLAVYVGVPLIIFAIASCALLIYGYSPNMWPPLAIQRRRVFMTLGLNVLPVFFGVAAFSRYFEGYSASTMKLFEKMLSTTLITDTTLDVDLRTEISYGYYLINQMLETFRRTIYRTSEIGQQLNTSALDLVAIANETESTAIEQSTGVSEIVSTMDSANRLAHEIEGHIAEVAGLATETAESVSSGLNVLKFSLDKMSQIEHANQATIVEIRDLNTKIGRIWEIVNLINSIADQTKIIAFNAELESVGAGRSGKNFRNVANEIRRLANNTMDSTEEIKKRINEMQTTANNLIHASLGTTDQIKHGYELAQLLENSFGNINSSVSANAGASNDIKQMVSQQATGFEQMTETVQQVNVSLQNFSSTTRSIIETANELKANSQTMEAIAGQEKEVN